MAITSQQSVDIMERSLQITENLRDHGLVTQPAGLSASIVGVPTSQELMCYQTWAKTAVDSQMYRGVGKEAGVMMIMLAAREFGIGPAQALNGGLNIIEGKVELSSRIMQALIRRAKHTLKIMEDTTERCTIYGKRADTGEEHKVSYSIEDAQRAGLVKEKGGWKKVPDDMLFARAMSKLARRLFSDVIGIGYVEGEITPTMPQIQSETATPDDNGINQCCSGQDVHLLEIEPSEEELMDKMLKGLDSEDGHLLMEFIALVGNHYKWTKHQTLKEFLKEPDQTYDKFVKWKEKRNP